MNSYYPNCRKSTQLNQLQSNGIRSCGAVYAGRWILRCRRSSCRRCRAEAICRWVDSDAKVFASSQLLRLRRLRLVVCDDISVADLGCILRTVKIQWRDLVTRLGKVDGKATSLKMRGAFSVEFNAKDRQVSLHLDAVVDLDRCNEILLLDRMLRLWPAARLDPVGDMSAVYEAVGNPPGFKSDWGTAPGRPAEGYYAALAASGGMRLIRFSLGMSGSASQKKALVSCDRRHPDDQSAEYWGAMPVVF